MNLRIIILAALLTGFCIAAEESDLETLVEYQANQLRAALDAKRWTVTHSGNSIQIESKFKMTVGRRVSPALGETLPKTSYRIELRFSPPLPREEYLRIARERVEPAAIAAYGAPTKEAYSEAIRFLEQNTLPRYSVNDRAGRSYSVYFTSTDAVTLSLGPTAQYAEARGVEGIVDSQLWPKTP
jgi:hypothetical protein